MAREGRRTMDDLFAPVKGTGISVQIVQQIQDPIRRGRIKPGHRLPLPVGLPLP